MRMVFDDELRELRASLRRFLEQVSSEADVRRLLDTPTGFDAAVWQRLAGELELLGLGVPGTLGGADAGQPALTVACEEFGRALYAGPYLATAGLALPLLLALPAGSERDDLIGDLAGGRQVAAVAHDEDGRWAESEVTTRAESAPDGWRLSGRKPYVLDATNADRLLVTAAMPDGLGVFAVEPAAAGVVLSAVELVDLTRRYAHVEFADVPARLLAADAGAAVRRAVDVAAVCLAAEQLGGAERLLELTVDHAKLRTQFGRVIGSFQAVKHRCVDALVAVEGARSAVYEASWALAEDDPQAGRSAALAQATASEAYCAAARTAIQVHGGIGFTWEHPAHLYYRRAHTSRLYLGTPRQHRARIARSLASP